MTMIDTTTIADVAPAQNCRRPSQHDAGPAKHHPTLSKSATVIKLLLRVKGASVAEMMAVTNWQPHSVRAFLSGLRKKGSVLTREQRKNGEQTYRIAEAITASGGAAPPAAMPALMSDAVA